MEKENVEFRTKIYKSLMVTNNQNLEIRKNCLQSGSRSDMELPVTGCGRRDEHRYIFSWKLEELLEKRE